MKNRIKDLLQQQRIVRRAKVDTFNDRDVMRRALEHADAMWEGIKAYVADACSGDPDTLTTSVRLSTAYRDENECLRIQTSSSNEILEIKYWTDSHGLSVECYPKVQEADCKLSWRASFNPYILYETAVFTSDGISYIPSEAAAYLLERYLNVLEAPEAARALPDTAASLSLN